MPVTDSELQEVLGAEILVAQYAKSGSQKLAENTAEALGKNNGCIMSHHGMIACGEKLEDAFDHCVMMEECGKNYLSE